MKTLATSIVLAAALALPAVAGAAEVDDAIKTANTTKDAQVRLKAVQKLGDLKDPKGIPALIAAFKPLTSDVKEDWFVRKAAVKALVGMGKESVEPLKKALVDPDGVVRTRAVDALGKLKPADVQQILETALKGDKEWSVRLEAVFAMRDSGDKKYLPALKAAAKDDESAAVRNNATKVVDKLTAG